MKVLISRPDKIGDVVLATHGIKQLKKLLPETEVYLHVSEYTAPLARNIKFIDGCVLIDEDVKDFQFDAVVDLMAKNRTARLYTAAGIGIRIGNSARWFQYRYNRTRYIRRSHALINEAEYNWELISLLDRSLKNVPLTSSLNVEDFKEIKEFTEFSEYYVLMPGVSVSARAWDLENWINLAKLLNKNGKDKVVFVVGPAEQDLAKELEAHKESDNIIIRSCPEIPDLIGLLSRAKAYVGPSTGITHLAAATGTAGVALYPEVKSMHPSRWAPFDSDFNILSLAKSPTPADVQQVLSGKKQLHLLPGSRSEISAFVVCCNEETNIRRCLDSIKWVDELVVVDSGSTDQTVEICKEYTDKVFYQEWLGHSRQKQFALEKCTRKWVLNIDSDEEVSPMLRGEILKVLSLPEDKQDRIAGYQICRVVHFLNRWWDRGGWYPEYRMRFFRRENTRWGGIDPHEKALVKGKIKKLRGIIYHYTYSGISEQIQALNQHSTNSARCLFREGARSSIVKIILHPLFRFFKFYILKFGFREGRAGFIVACIESMYTFFKYAKLWEIQSKSDEHGVEG